MKIKLKKVSNTEHQLRCERKDGTIEEAELETKSFLVHDFTHFAYELEAGLGESFWGLVAGGKTFLELRDPMQGNYQPSESELVRTEMIVGPMQSVVQGKRSADELLNGLENLFSAHGVELPNYLNTDLILNVRQRFQKLIGEWNVLPFGSTMVIIWPEL